MGRDDPERSGFLVVHLDRHGHQHHGAGVPLPGRPEELGVHPVLVHDVDPLTHDVDPVTHDVDTQVDGREAQARRTSPR